MNNIAKCADWDHASVGSLAQVIMGQSPNSENVNDDELGVPFIQGNAEFTEKFPFPIHWVKIPLRVSNAGDILLSVRAPVGELNLSDQVYCIGRGLSAIHNNSDIDDLYLWYSFQINRFQLFQFAQGSTFQAVNRDNIKHIIIDFPKSVSEQRKIAEILSTLDSLICANQSIIDKYRYIKTGIQQDLLSIKPNWVKSILGDKSLFLLKAGGTPSTLIPKYWGGGIPWLASGEVHRKLIWATERTISKDGLEHSNATFIPKRSILIALAGQGKTRGTVAVNEIELTTNQSVAAIIPVSDDIDSYFLYHLLDSQYQQLRSFSLGAGRAGLSLSSLAKYPICFPKKNIQEEIANKFNTIDQVLQKKEQLLSKLYNLKQALMQDLLTGKVRVTSLL